MIRGPQTLEALLDAANRFDRDVRLVRLYEGTTQIQQIVIARSLVREAMR